MPIKLKQTVEKPVRSLALEARDLYLAMFAKPAEFNWTEDSGLPIIIGPTWIMSENGYWEMPERTLGWECLVWCHENLQHSPGQPWTFTPEQARFILHWYSLNENGSFVYRDAVLQRLKGWGKDPLGACLCLFEMLGPCRLDEWNQDAPGKAIGKENKEAWVQTAAVSLEQTKNTMRLLPGLITKECKARYQLQLGKEQVYGLLGERFFQAVTSSPATLEGARATFVLLNETGHWKQQNGGHDMSEVIDRNATKSPDGSARTLRITNAFIPGEDSVAERDRQAYDECLGQFDIGILYDSLEAPYDAELDVDTAPKIIELIRGDSHWLNVDRIVKAILDPRHDPSESRRFWYNQITASADKWLEDFILRGRILDTTVNPGTMITLGFDGSRKRNRNVTDATALVACRVVDGHLFLPLDRSVWEQPPNAKDWMVPTTEVDLAVNEIFTRYNVVGFFADPHKWETWVAQWEAKYGKRLKVKASPNHPIQWWFNGGRGKTIVNAIEQFENAVYDGELTIDTSYTLLRHLLNAHKRPSPYGMQIAKEHPDSAMKIDAAIAAILAFEARKQVIAKGILNKFSEAKVLT